MATAPTFTQTVGNFYVRDPRTPAGNTNGFYNDNSPQPPANGGTPYAPNSFNNIDPAGGVGYGTLTGYGNNLFLPNKTGQATPDSIYGQVAPTVNGYASPAVVPGLKTLYPTSDTAGPQSFTTKISYKTPATSQTASSVNRLNSSSLPPGADYINQFSLSGESSDQTMDRGQDDRIFISDPSGKLIGAGGPLMSKLEAISGVLFPYTPTITFGHKAHYETESLMHTNYDMPVYKNSTVEQIGIQAKFTANDSDEAQYVMAVIHFFRAATKMFYGQDGIAGTPPVVLRLDGYGRYLLPHLPVVCAAFDFSLPEDVDYISTSPRPSSGTAGTPGTLVPTVLQVNLTFRIVHSRNRIANGFGLEKFSKGFMYNGYTGRGTGGKGGFI